MGKTLVVYYSYSGATKSLAENIALLTDGDIRELIPEKPYSFAWHGATKEARSEVEREYCPRLLSGNEPVDGYETIFIGSPNWFKSFAPPVLSFLRGAGLGGKIIIPFCTHGGGGFGQMESRMAQECPGAKLLPGLAAAAGFDEHQVASWLESLGLPPAR